MRPTARSVPRPEVCSRSPYGRERRGVIEDAVATVPRITAEMDFLARVAARVAAAPASAVLSGDWPIVGGRAGPLARRAPRKPAAPLRLAPFGALSGHGRGRVLLPR
jgi:hypothetical protein